MAHIFDGDTSATSITLGAKHIEDVASATSLEYAFAHTSALTTLDLSGIGSSAIKGDVDDEGVAYTGMRHMLDGSALVDKTRTDERKVTIGSAFTKVLNGFVWDRESVNENPAYVLQADIEVKDGGPTSKDALMECPTMEGNAYSGAVNLIGGSVEYRQAWILRHYVDLEIEGTPIDPTTGQGDLIASGYIGYEGIYEYAGPFG